LLFSSKNNRTIKSESIQNASTKKQVPANFATVNSAKLNDSKNENNQCDSGAMAFPDATAWHQAMRTKYVSLKNPVKTTSKTSRIAYLTFLFNSFFIFFNKTIAVDPKHPHKKNKSVNDDGKGIGMIEFCPLARVDIQNG
jgi:hypothetical protein